MNTMEKYALIASLMPRSLCASGMQGMFPQLAGAEILTIAPEICNVDGRYYERGGRHRIKNT